ncbi:MAG: cytochrome c [Bdellovibrionaceae bacterium]|nr:cytochrome c [Pseudobdellovibrionaceae bacterium]
MKKLVMISGALLSASVIFVACLSSSKKDERTPAAAAAYNDPDLQKYLATDPFAKDGYDHNVDGTYTNRKFQFGTQLPEADAIKELAGREIWFKSAPNERLHSYYFPQSLNSPIAWYKILRGDRREQRFNSWGLINDPDCCTPGKDCGARGMKYQGRTPNMSDTYGWDYCVGDEALLNSLKDPKANKWEDPACDHPIVKAADTLDNQPRESRCELAFGNPTGAIGYRKFPNPRFNAARWAKIGGWQGYEKRMTESEIDSSIETPFRVGKACASCHAAFDPLNPPKNVNHPTWKNVKGETGNQYLNISAILGSGVKHDTIEYQMFVHSRPGVVDTSAVPNDFVNDGGTVNAIINFAKRPTFKDKVDRWVNVESCSPSETCQVIRYQNGGQKYWKRSTETREVMHILKGGEDSVGPDLAVQRVYANIGMCAEQCWTNHLTNTRELDPSIRGYGQTPFDIGQCRNQCASWRANEDRVGDILSYLLSRRPTDLKDVVFKAKPENLRETELESYLNTRYGGAPGSNLVQNGKNIFAKNCAQCHSSQNSNKNDMSAAENFEGIDFKVKDVLATGEELRLDWMGNDKSTRVDEVGTYKCRAAHSNHMKGHVWQDFTSENSRDRAPVLTNARSQKIGGGRGYYRNISLLNAWAHAPFMHNNAIGPEICGNEPDREFNPWRSTVEGTQVDPSTKYNCAMYFNPSVEARLKLYEASVDELLTPSAKRVKKVALTDQPIRFPLGLSLNFIAGAAPMYLEFPKGMPVNAITSLDIKSLATDLIAAVPYYEAWAKAPEDKKVAQRNLFDQFWWQRAGSQAAGIELGQTAMGTFETLRITNIADLNSKPKDWLETIKKDQNARLKIYLKYYSNCDAYYENLGHDFGTGLPQDDKKALKAFLATL